MQTTTVEKITYLLDYLDFYMVSAVQDVLNDSIDNPKHSAVTTTNLIKCYIDVKKALDQEISFSSVSEYLQFNCFTHSEIFEFEQRRLLEANYYIGKQY